MPSPRPFEPPEQPHRSHRLLAAIGLRRGSRIDEEELSSAILGTVVGLSTMVAAGAHGTLGQVELTVEQPELFHRLDESLEPNRCRAR